jgi:hypothetical protein
MDDVVESIWDRRTEAVWGESEGEVEVPMEEGEG